MIRFNLIISLQLVSKKLKIKSYKYMYSNSMGSSLVLNESNQGKSLQMLMISLKELPN